MRIDRFGADFERACNRQVAERLGRALVSTNTQHGAVAQIKAVGDLVDTVGAGFSACLKSYVRPAAADLPDICVRLSSAEGEACPLDVSARRVE